MAQSIELFVMKLGKYVFKIGRHKNFELKI